MNRILGHTLFPVYGGCVLFGGFGGMFFGMYQGFDKIRDSPSIKLQPGLERFELAFKGLVNGGIVAGNMASTALTCAAVVATFPISVHILMQYRVVNDNEKKSA